METKYFVVTNCDDNEVVNVVGIIMANSPMELLHKLKVAARSHFDDTDLRLVLSSLDWNFGELTGFSVPFSIGLHFSGVLDVTLSQIF